MGGGDLGVAVQEGSEDEALGPVVGDQEPAGLGEAGGGAEVVGGEGCGDGEVGATGVVPDFDERAEVGGVRGVEGEELGSVEWDHGNGISFGRAVAFE
jgi:hypothetical protein